MRVVYVLLAAWTLASLVATPVITYTLVSSVMRDVFDVSEMSARSTGVSIAAIAGMSFTGGAIYYAVNLLNRQS